MQYSTRQLHGLQLRQRTRAMLVAAGKGTVQVVQSSGSKGWYQRCSAHTLALHGLVTLSRARGVNAQGRSQAGMLFATITPLGHEVLACYAYQFETGQRLHWRKLRSWLERKREYEQLLQAVNALRSSSGADVGKR